MGPISQGFSASRIGFLTEALGISNRDAPPDVSPGGSALTASQPRDTPFCYAHKYPDPAASSSLVLPSIIAITSLSIIVLMLIEIDGFQ
jgi:hypothetical protein